MRRAVSSYIGKASKDFGAEEEVIGAGGAALVLSYSGLHLYEEAVSWVPSPLAGEGQGEGKSSGNESTHPNEKCCKEIEQCVGWVLCLGTRAKVSLN